MVQGGARVAAKLRSSGETIMGSKHQKGYFFKERGNQTCQSKPSDFQAAARPATNGRGESRRSGQFTKNRAKGNTYTIRLDRMKRPIVTAKLKHVKGITGKGGGKVRSRN